METISEKKVSHTPGPWRAVEEFEGWAVIKADKKPSIGRQYIAVEIAQGYDMGEADAKLIAAAPELLEALKAIYYHIKDHSTEIHKDSMLSQLVTIAIKKATE